MPKISVIMPVHNEPEKVLRTAINSILNQTFKDFEFIIINDASENNAEEVILSYKDDRIKYYKNKKNLKVIKTLNKGLKLATGEYIARMDADDISFKKRLEKQVDILDNNPEVGLVSSSCYIFPNKRVIEPPNNHEDIEKVLKYSVNCIVHPVVMFRRSLIEKYNLKYSLKYLHIEDYQLWIEFTKVTKLYSIYEPLILHREWENSVSYQNKMEQYYSAQNLVFESMLEDIGIKNKPLQQIYNSYLRGNFISKSDFLDFDKVIYLALDKALTTMNPKWYNYVFKTLNDLRIDIYRKTV